MCSVCLQSLNELKEMPITGCGFALGNVSADMFAHNCYYITCLHFMHLDLTEWFQLLCSWLQMTALHKS